MFHYVYAKTVRNYYQPCVQLRSTHKYSKERGIGPPACHTHRTQHKSSNLLKYWTTKFCERKVRSRSNLFPVMVNQQQMEASSSVYFFIIVFIYTGHRGHSNFFSCATPLNIKEKKNSTTIIY